MKEYSVKYNFTCFPHSRSRDGIIPAVLHVSRAAIILNPHFPKLHTRTPMDRSSRDCVAPYRTPRAWHLPVLFRLSDQQLFLFSPFFYSHALLCRACSFTHVHYSSLPAHWQSKRWRRWTEDHSSRDYEETWKTTTENVIFAEFWLHFLCQSHPLLWQNSRSWPQRWHVATFQTVTFRFSLRSLN